MSERVVCFVTSAEEGRPAFAIRSDNDESVFISTKLAEEQGIEEGDRLQIIMIANQNMPEKTPWFAIWVTNLDDQEAQA